MVLSVHRLPVLSFSILQFIDTDAVVFALRLLENFLQLCFEVYFVVFSSTTTYDLYLLVGFPFVFLAKPSGNLHKSVGDGCSCSLLHEDMHVLSSL